MEAHVLKISIIQESSQNFNVAASYVTVQLNDYDDDVVLLKYNQGLGDTIQQGYQADWHTLTKVFQQRQNLQVMTCSKGISEKCTIISKVENV